MAAGAQTMLVIPPGTPEMSLCSVRWRIQALSIFLTEAASMYTRQEVSHRNGNLKKNKTPCADSRLYCTSHTNTPPLKCSCSETKPRRSWNVTQLCLVELRGNPLEQLRPSKLERRIYREFTERNCQQEFISKVVAE